MSHPIAFDFEDHAVRVIVEAGETWFVASDICNALGYANSRKAVADHLDEDEKGVTTGYTLGGNQQLSVINESGLYSLIFGSKKPSAKRFKRWVTSEVLPSLRKNGSYHLPGLTGGHEAPAPQFVTSNPAHAADMAVSAGRVFREIMRSARSAGIDMPNALKLAAEQAQARTGVNMLSALKIDPEAMAATAAEQARVLAAEAAARAAAIEAAKPRLDQTPQALFLRDWQDGSVYLCAGDPLPFCPCTGRQLYSAFQLWCGYTTSTWPTSEARFIQFVGRQPDWQVGKSCSTYVELGSRTVKTRKMVIPSQKALIDANCQPPAGQNLTSWLTDGYFKFADALNNALLKHEATHGHIS